MEIWLFAGSGEGYGMGDIHHLKASVFLTVPEARRGEARRGEAGVGGGGWGGGWGGFHWEHQGGGKAEREGKGGREPSLWFL